MTHIKGTTGTPGDVHDFPNGKGAIRDVIVDLMHYAYRRNAGKSPEDIFYIDVNKEFELAKEAVHRGEGARSPLPSIQSRRNYTRALSEAPAKMSAPNSSSSRLPTPINTATAPGYDEKHVSQFAAQEKTFTEERKRYVGDYHRARDLSDALERREKIDALTLAASSKLTK